MGIYTKLLREDSNIDRINITPEQINELAKFLNNNISISSIDENTKIINESFNFDFLDKLGIKDSKKIKDSADKLSKNVAKTIKEEGINKNSKSKILNYYNNFFKSINKFLDSSNLDVSLSTFGKEYDLDKLKDGFLILSIGTLATSIIYYTLIIIFGFKVAQILTTSIVGPIIEETEKQVAIRRNCMIEYTALFNSFEFSQYFFMLKPIFGTVNAVKIRLIPVGMHLTNTIIQFLTSNITLQKKLGIENNKTKQTKLTLIGQISATLIHSIYNSIMLIFNNKIIQSMVH